MVIIERDGHRATVEYDAKEGFYVWWCCDGNLPWGYPHIVDEGWEAWSSLWLALRAWRLHVACYNGEINDFETYYKLRAQLPNMP